MVIVGSVLVGIGLGLFKKLANSRRMVGPRFLTTFIFFICLAFILITPWFKYPHVAHQMRQAPESTHHMNSAYYEDRGMAVAYFFLNGILMALISFACLNALQHPEIKESVLNIWGYLVPTVVCFVLDSQIYVVQLPISCIVIAIILFVLITAFNLLKTFNQTPICC